MERLSAEDARILRLESPTVAGHTLKVLLLDEVPGRPPLEVGELCDRISARLHRTPRLMQRVVLDDGPGTPGWVRDEGFDITHHVRQWSLSDGADALRQHVERLMSQRLDRRRPLWTLDVVDGVGHNQTVLVLKLHHAMADGTGALRIASALLWEKSPGPAEVSRSAPPAGGAPRANVGQRRALARALTRRRQWHELLRETRSLPTALERELSPRVRPTSFARPVGTRRAVAFAAFPVADARAVKRSLGGDITINDVVLAVTAAGLRRWLEQHGQPLSALRVKVPVSLHAHDETTASVGNRDSCFFVELPMAEPDPVRRLLDISHQAARCKRLGDAQALDLFFRDVAHVSGWLGRAAVRWSMSPRVFTLNVSNVAGPAGPLKVCGRRVAAVHSVAEIADWHAVRVSALSAAGVLTFGICTDPEVVEDVEVIAEGISAGFAELVRAAG